MKKLIALLALAWSFSLQGQSVDEIKYQIEELSKRKTSLDSEIVVVTEKITAKSELLIELQTQGFVKNLTLKSNREIGVLDQKNTTNWKPAICHWEK